MNDGAELPTAEHLVPCSDLDEALRSLTGQLGFRLETIFPADEPRVAVVSGHGLRLRLHRGRPEDAELRASVAGSEPSFTLTRLRDGAWSRGRAGMQYRDLVPGRLGGRLVASHLRIPDGGPVPDSVHFHDVRFQLIYCRRGWVRVAYQDQGPPFVLEVGDGVLQPPGIRHRVLEASAGLEVVEVAVPAEHATHLDHELPLPTERVDRARRFGAQAFVRHVAAEATWTQGPVAGSEARDLGIAEATNGLASARVVRLAGRGRSTDGPRRPHDEQWRTPDDGVRFGFVLRGGGELHRRDDDVERIEEGDAFVVPQGLEVAILATTPALEMLEVDVACLDAS